MSNENQKPYDGTENLNPEDISFWSLISEDYRTHDSRVIQGFLTLFVHRYGNWRMGIKNRFVRIPFSIVYKFLFLLTELLFGIKLSYNVKVGRRVKIEHFGGMVLGARQIGDDVTIRQNTTFGIARKNDLNAKPTIENNVDIGCGAVILGNITIGVGSTIGANAVVVTDIPPNSLAVGVPAKVIKTMCPE